VLRLDKFTVTISALGLIVLFSLLIVVQAGCSIKLGKLEKVEKTTESEKPAPDPSTVDLSEYFPSEEKLKARIFADINKDGNEEIIFLSGKSWDFDVQDPYLIN